MNDQPPEPKLLEHEADGIRELDNLLPRWWVWLFYGCIAYSVAYMLYYHVFKSGPLQAAEFDAEWKAGEAIKSAALAKFEATIGTLTPSQDKLLLGQGQQVFMTYCAPCHRPDGGGLVGPNLCDDYWIHGSNFVDNVKIIINGVPDKGMLTWRGILKPGEVHAVASYIYQFRGTKPPNPKPREDQAPKQTGPSPFE